MELDEAVRPCWMEIDLGALADNVQVLRSRLGPDRHIIAALKGDAYGHGIGPVARCLARGDVHSLGDGEPPGCGCDPGSSAEIDDFCG